MFYTKFNTPVCEIILAGNEEGLKHLHLNTGQGKRRFEVLDDWHLNTDFFANVSTQINEYFAGKLKYFDVKLAPGGTEFQKQVWVQLQQIPYGETRTYGEIAATLGNPAASRAVGTANGRNPIPLIIPCHRVIGAGGQLTGYAHGLKTKQQLLELETRLK